MIDVVITVILILFGLVFTKSKLVAAVFFLFMWTLWGWNTWNGDYDAYATMYDNSVFSTALPLEFGFHLLTKFFASTLGVSFSTFLLVYSFVILALNYGIAIKFSTYPALYSVAYFLIFIMEFVFLRNYLSDTLLLLAFALVLKDVRHSKFWFFVLLFICSTIHTTSIVFFVFTYAIYAKKVINIKKAILFFLLLTVMSAFLLNIMAVVTNTQLLEKMQYYQLSNAYVSNISIFHLGLVLFVYYFFHTLVLDKKNNIPVNWRRIYVIALNINIISLFYLSLYFHIPYFSRMLKMLFAFDILFFLSAFYFVSTVQIRRKMYIMFAGMLIILVLFFFKSTTFPNTIIPLYKCNLIWGNEYYVPIL